MLDSAAAGASPEVLAVLAPAWDRVRRCRPGRTAAPHRHVRRAGRMVGV